MPMKICTKCHKEKESVEFYKNSNVKSGLTSWCKQCQMIYIQQRHKKYPWKRCLHDIKARCYNPKNGNYYRYGEIGIKNFLTENEIKFLWFRDKASKLNKPSIHRKKSYKHYTLYLIFG